MNEPRGRPAAELATEIERLERALEHPVSPAERAEITAALVAVVRRIDALAEELASLRERGRQIATRLRQLPASRPGPSPAESGRGNPEQLRADHLNASTFIEKGWSLIAQGDHAGARAALSRALELAPGTTEALSLRGWAEVLAEQTDQALATFSEVLARDPNHALARVNVGLICLRKRIFGEAIEHLSRVIRLDTDRKATLYAHYYLGLVYLERRMYGDACAFFERAIAQGPNLIEAYYDLGRAQWFAGNQEGARDTWRRGAAASRFAPGAKRCQELLDAVARGEPVPSSSSAA